MKYPWLDRPRKNYGVTLWDFLGLVYEMRYISLLTRSSSSFKFVYFGNLSSRILRPLRDTPQKGRGGMGHGGRT